MFISHHHLDGTGRGKPTRGRQGPINPMMGSDAYMRQETKPSLVQIMACCLIGTKPLYKPIMAYSLLDTW